ncbi:helix-turn-helix domain-containing protein [Actinacidiphila sp. ITFR-21]|uniref:helix-turn-helix domain-containing protein n=1 Tax=Actinacidiphila sp. ITFR-21 TaxID=3075199 RepID=UPI00288A16D8|nr:helix-turn-helix domain-containing protein [Streptomyces sp. ITFR-21]WNI14324.1 helix-turn-helix domain-containing protein [Streptomyces sp. ITFR-21]
MADGLDSVGARDLFQALLSDPNADPRDMQRRFDWPAPHVVSALGQLVDLQLIVPAPAGEGPQGADGAGSGEGRQPALQPPPAQPPAQPPAPPLGEQPQGRRDAGGGSRLSTASPRSSLLRLIEQEEAELEALVSRVRVIRTAMAALAAEYGTLHARETGRECAEVVLGREEIDALLVEAGRGARREVLSMNHPLPLTAQLLAGRDAGGGPAARVLHLASTVRTPRGQMAAHALRDARTEVRLAAHTPLRVLVVDCSLAVLEVVEERALPAALLLSGRGSAEVVREVFEFCWLSARPLHAFAAQEADPDTGAAAGARTGPAPGPVSGPAPGPASGRVPAVGADAAGPAARPGLPEPNELQRAALRMLTNGMKDEAIARQLGISVRTLGRLIGSLMADLNVTSRYQLGVQASMLGWAY